MSERLAKNTKPFGTPTLERHAKMEELIKLRIRGATQQQCAEKLGVSRRAIIDWMSKPEWRSRFMKTKATVFQKIAPSEEIDADGHRGQQLILDTEKVIHDLIEQSSVKAVREILAVMENKKTPLALKLKAAIDLADRGSRTQKTKKVQQTSVGVLLTPQDLAHASATAREILEFNHPIEALDIDASDMTDASDNEP